MKKDRISRRQFGKVTGAALASVWLNPINILSLPSRRRKTEASIRDEMFLINGSPTYEGRVWKGKKIEGLLLNSRMVQGIFDDLNPETRYRWAFPDTGKWNPDRNTTEFIAAMPSWRRHGLLAFTLNLQGGSPEGYSREQPWHNSAFKADGSLRDDYQARLIRVLNAADSLGMVVILGLFYFGQDERLKDEDAIKRAVDNAIDWLLEQDYRNIIVEINNETDVPQYEHDILKPSRVHELIRRAKDKKKDGRRLLVSTSFKGGSVPGDNVVRASDFLLIHGNGIKNPNYIAQMVRECRQVPGYKPMPIIFNEDDHFDYDKPNNNFRSALSEYASWGFFDPGLSNYRDGYQCPPVDWTIGTERKKEFFGKVREITGS